MTVTQPIRLPLDRSTRANCWTESRKGNHCMRHPRHTGRHVFYRRHIDGAVREVWA